MEAQFTPGPWKLYNKNGIISIYANNKEVIKWTGFDSSDYPEDAIANARLISQAPTMYQKLADTVEFLDRYMTDGTGDIGELREDLVETLHKITHL